MQSGKGKVRKWGIWGQLLLREGEGERGEETCVSNEDGKGESWIKRQP